MGIYFHLPVDEQSTSYPTCNRACDICKCKYINIYMYIVLKKTKFQEH